MDSTRIFTVSEYTRYIKAHIEGDPVLARVWVRGEISNFHHHTSGHMYFTLKDAGSSLRCVMFRGANRSLKFRPANGMQIIAGGNTGVYERGGSYQLYVRELQPDGVGALHIAFEQLKAKLQAEGLFDESRKRPLPRLPRRIGIVTSPTGAALRDMVKVIRRRFPRVTLVVCPAAVQGDEAPAQIARGVNMLNGHGRVDVIIAGRGGGSMEDLWAFNDEGVARAIARSQVPVISAVGHETDFTIADFVADVRAATPSMAAELVVPDEKTVYAHLDQLRTRLAHGLRRRWQQGTQDLDRILSRPAFRDPARRIGEDRRRVEELSRRGLEAARRDLERREAGVKVLAGRLETLSPLGILSRGYSLARRADDGRVIRSYRHVERGDTVEVLLAEGKIDCIVEAAGGGGVRGIGD